MPRRHPARRSDRPAAAAGAAPRVAPPRVDDFGGIAYEVRTVGGAPGRGYRCPGCDQLIAPGTLHVVVWAAAGDGEDRRHWHSACWSARSRRGVTRRWS